MKFSIIMPVWITTDELYELTRQSLLSIASADGFSDCELVIVDNASTIGADQLLTNADIYIRNKENLGYPKAVNQGIALATGDVYTIANNDIKVSSNWIKATEEIFEKLDNVGSVHYKMVGYDEPLNLSDDVWEEGKERWCTGSFFTFSQDAVDDLVTEFGCVVNEDYGLGGYDDWDWHHRLNHLLGYNSVYTNGVGYQHKDSSTQLMRDKKERSESDKKNREMFKEMWGDYPEDIWEKKYPEQFKVPWRPFP